ncbi:MAG: hypothetical protein E6I97_24255 [Chloroflexi bacterium]|nr:MAG: hypothetical protein E6I97_24255 [Chloroflexota bacterium]
MSSLRWRRARSDEIYLPESVIVPVGTRRRGVDGRRPCAYPGGGGALTKGQHGTPVEAPSIEDKHKTPASTLPGLLSLQIT